MGWDNFCHDSTKDYQTWINSPDDGNPAIQRYVITKFCSDGLQKETYTVEEGDHYYFFYYITTACYVAYHQGSLLLHIEKSEYSLSGVKMDGFCGTYESPSCTVSVPLQAGYEKALVTVGGSESDTYRVTFSSFNRKWAYFVVVLPALLLIAGVLIVTTVKFFKLPRVRRLMRQKLQKEKRSLYQTFS